MSTVHITVTDDAGTVHYRNIGSDWRYTDPTGWDAWVTVPDRVDTLNELAGFDMSPHTVTEPRNMRIVLP